MVKRGYSYLMSRLLITVAILFPFLSVTFAQDVKIKINAPETVMTGEQFRVDYVIESMDEVGKPIIFKNMDGFNILYGPATSSSASVSFKDGKRARVYNFTSTYYLEAQKEGKFNLPKAEISFKGKKYKSKVVKIEVKSPDKITGEVEAFVKAILSKDRVNLSDTLMLTYRLYTTKEISRLLNTDFPAIEGFYATNITHSRQRFDEETVDGKKYQVVDLRKLILQPRDIGQKTIAEGMIVVEYAAPTGRKMRDMWGDVYNETIKSQKTLTIQPVTIRVQDLKAI